MGQIKTPNPVKLIVSALAPGEGLLAAAREAGSDRYVQRRIAGATLDFPGQEAQLLATIRAWLNANAAGNETGE